MVDRLCVKCHKIIMILVNAAGYLGYGTHTLIRSVADTCRLLHAHPHPNRDETVKIWR
jgi:hypothetical protein